MKKLISLLLVLVLVMGCMGTFALADVEDYDLPYVIAPENAKKAVWQAKTADGEIVYFLCLDTQHMEWAVEQPGGVTFTALKDSDFTPDGVEIPAEWDANNPIVIDLNGHSFTTRGSKPQINMKGDGNLTLKNGTIKHTGTHRFINLSRTSAGNNDGAGHYYNPTLTLENLYINFQQADPLATNAPIIESKMVHFTLNIKNCTLVSDNREFCSIANMENITNTATINIDGSILGAPSDRVFRLFGDDKTSTVNMNITNSALFNNEGNIVGGIHAKAINAGGVLVPNWTATTPDGETLASVASVFGTAPTQTTIPEIKKIDLTTGEDKEQKDDDTVNPAPTAPKADLELRDAIIMIVAVAIAVTAVAFMLIMLLSKPKAKKEKSAE